MPQSPTEFFIARFREMAACVAEPVACYRPRPYRNAAVRFRACSIDDYGERRELLQAAGLNVFQFPAHKIPGCDLLSDSGTTTMTMEQWSQLLLGDEAYGSNEGFYELKTRLAETFGPDWAPASGGPDNLFIFHQGRAAEHALATAFASELLPAVDLARARSMVATLDGDLRAQVEKKLLRPDRPFLIIPSNSHFDTTEGNFEASNLVPLNLPSAEHRRDDTGFGFRGNLDLDALGRLLSCCHELVPLVYLTVTNNTAGGQPVSIENIRAVRALADRYDLPLFFDACRFAENAWFVQRREPGCSGKTIPVIVREMFSLVDGFHISLKKDGLANIGGGLVMRPGGRFEQKYPRLLERLTDHQIMVEGHPTYGGLAGRDLKAIAEGLRTVLDQRYLTHRIEQVQRFGARLASLGVPVIEPVGGSAVYIDMDRFFQGTPARDDEFRGIALTALLLLAGHRLCELGTYAFGKWRNGSEIGPDPRVNNVRAAVPRLAYEDADLSGCAEAVRVLYEHRERIPAVEVTSGRELSLRHFKSRFRLRT